MHRGFNAMVRGEAMQTSPGAWVSKKRMVFVPKTMESLNESIQAIV